MESEVFVSTRKVQKMRQIMTARDRKCSKEGTLVILYDLSANALTEKVSENPLKVRKMRQIMAVQDGKCSKQRDYVRLCIGSISAKSV